ncbi:MAG: hypothetical protein E6G28_00175 [Actinobacteria bacterium]|nr:MAG: hypothetical protein E6G28_00175 [Actinomycetota bacterium]
MGPADPWWRGGVLYQIYPRSFADANGDGIGDLPGIVSRLDYLEWLGIDGIWLNPIHPSPNVDWGYDVADYFGVHPDLGTLADVDRLVAEAEGRGIRVLLDLVPNHTSDRHPWFRARPELYVWANEIPNNWLAAFGGGSAWTLDPERGRYYLHNFAPEQPDLDWWNPEVREKFERILRFWFDRGVAGFRIDVANALVKDRELRDNPPANENDDPWSRRRGFTPLYNANRPEVHEIYREWRALADGYDPPRVLVGEAWVWDFARWAAFWGTEADELNMAFNFQLLDAPFEADALREVVERTQRPAGVTATRTWHAALCSCCSRCAGHRSSTTATSSRSRTDTCLRIGSSTARNRRATRVARRCRGRPRAAGPIPGCRSRTRAGTSRRNAPTRRPRSTSPAI